MAEQLLRLCVRLALLTQVAYASVYELDGDNFERLVFRKSTKVAFIKFYAPWCGHCQKLAPDWRKVEKKFDKSSDILIGSVDCSAGPNGRNPLCDEHKAMALPTLSFFHYPSKKGTTYEGNKTAEDLLEFAGELASSCSIAMQDDCTEQQKEWLQTYDGMPIPKLKEKAQEKSMEMSMAKMQMMMVQMQMQQTYQDKSMSQDAKDAKMKEFESQAKEANDKVEAAWAESGSHRAMKMVLREKSAYDPADDIDMFDQMGGMGGMGGGAPPKKKSKKKKKKKAKDEV